MSYSGSQRLGVVACLTGKTGYIARHGEPNTAWFCGEVMPCNTPAGAAAKGGDCAEIRHLLPPPYGTGAPISVVERFQIMPRGQQVAVAAGGGLAALLLLKLLFR